MSLASALQEYLDDANFDQNRIEYKTNKAAAEGGSGKKSNKKPDASGTSARVDFMCNNDCLAQRCLTYRRLLHQN